MKRSLWLFLSDSAHPAIHLVIPTIAWMAHEAGAEFECYLEAEREGGLFARQGSTVLGGMHHQQLNYLSAWRRLKRKPWCPLSSGRHTSPSGTS